MLHKLIQCSVLSLAVVVAVPAFGAAPAAAPPTTPTAAEHLAMAKKYQDQADAHRKEAQEHREMAANYKKGLDALKTLGQRNPDVVKMEQHCSAIASAAEKLAADEQKAADYHTLRAKELQGK
jgi:hypothetical protein